MHKAGIFLTSKNNYTMLDEWASLYDYENVIVLNLDVGSSLESIKAGKKICEKHGIFFMESKSSSMQDNALEACNFFKERNIEWCIYSHQDAYPLTLNFFDKLDSILSNDSMSEFGTIGFNIYHDQNEINQWDPNNEKLMTLARTPLELGEGWYRVKHTSRCSYDKFPVDKPFAIEIPMWSTFMFNIDLYIEEIDIDRNFQFFHAWDDVAMQFLNKNIYNIALPMLSFAHDQSLKLNHNLPKKSPETDSKKRYELYGRFDHLKIWKDKWKFEYDINKNFLKRIPFLRKVFFKILNSTIGTSFLETVSRNSYKKVRIEYAGTLIDEFYNHDPKNGPLRTFSFEVNNNFSNNT
tara:strand:+ start:3145 stop:4197 length:1053 start_codon:yes stop_codon:yes gene_type:complete